MFQTNPRAFVSDNSGVFLGCFWETETGFASFAIQADTFGSFADASLSMPGLELFTTESSGSIDLAGAEATFDLADVATGDAHTASASATFTPLGSPVSSTQLGARFQTRIKEQALEPTGTLAFSTGDSFVIDDEHCDALSFDVHSTTSAAAGNKRGPVPVNDGPEGAIPLQLGSRFNAMNTGARPSQSSRSSPAPRGPSTTSAARSGTRSKAREDRSPSTQPAATSTPSSGSTRRPAEASRRSPASTTCSSSPWARHTRPP